MNIPEKKYIGLKHFRNMYNLSFKLENQKHLN